MKTTFQTFLRFIFVTLALLVTCTVHAATVTWTGNSGDNLWHTDANWSGGIVPGFDDDVAIDVSGNPIITIAAGHVRVRSVQCAESLQLQDATMVLTDGRSSFSGSLTLLGGSIAVDGASVLASVAGPTLLQGAACFAHSGAKLWLTNLTTLMVTATGNITLWAQAADSAIYLSNVTNVVASPGYALYIQALDGGLVDLHRLRNPDGTLWVYSRAAGTVDLSGLSGTLTAPVGDAHTFYVDDGDILMPQVTALNRATVSVTGGGRVVFGSLSNAEESSFYAYSGAKLWLTNLTTLLLTNAGLTFWAQHGEAAIYLPNVTNILSGVGHTLYAHAYEGGLIDLHRLGNPNSSLSVFVRSAGSVVDLSGLSGRLAAPAGTAHNFTADAGVILMPLVTALNRVNVNVTGDGQVGFGPLTNAEESAFYAYTGGKLWLTNLTALVLTNGQLTMWAQGTDTVIDASSLTNLVGNSGYGLHVTAYEGALVDLHRLRNPNGSLNVQSGPAGSVIDLSALSGTLAAPSDASHSFTADGGAILMPQVKGLIRASVSVTGDGRVGFGALTNAQESSFYAYKGGKLWLTNLTVLVLTNGSMTFWAQQEDTAIYLSNVTNLVASSGYPLFVHAYEGGFVDLHRLRNPNGPLWVYSRSAGSVVDLSGLGGALTAPAGTAHSFTAEAGAILMPQVTALKRVNTFVAGEGQVTFSSLTNIDESALYAYNGGKLWLTNVTTLFVTNAHFTLTASGAEAAIYLSNVTNAVFSDLGYGLYVNANGGGEVDLRLLRNPDGPISVSASSLGSVVNLSAFSGTLTGRVWNSHSITVSSGGAVLMPNVTGLDRVSVLISDEGQLPTANWHAITRSALSVTQTTNNFERLTNVLGTSFFAYAGGQLWLTNVTTLIVTNGTVVLQAWHEAAAIHLPNVTHIVISSDSALSVYASDGGVVDLQNVGNISGGNFYVLSSNPAALVDLSGLTALTPRTGGSSLQTLDGGVIVLNDTALLIANVALDFESSPSSIIPPFANPGTDMVLYAHAWNAYLVEARDTRDPDSPWKLYLRVAMTNAIQTIAPLASDELAFRVSELVAEPPALRILGLGNQQTQVILFGVPGQNYRLESKPVLDAAAAWQNGPSVPFTNAFRIFPPASSMDPSRFYRARKL